MKISELHEKFQIAAKQTVEDAVSCVLTQRGENRTGIKEARPLVILPEFRDFIAILVSAKMYSVSTRENIEMPSYSRGKTASEELGELLEDCLSSDARIRPIFVP